MHAAELTLVWPNKEALRLEFVPFDEIDKLIQFSGICFYSFLFFTTRMNTQLQYSGS